MTRSRRHAGFKLGAHHTLARTGWFSEQSPSFQERILLLARWRSIRAGETLFMAGDAADGVYGLEKGLLELSYPLSDEQMVSFHRAQPGFWVGVHALVSNLPRGISVTAIEDGLLLMLPVLPLKRHFEQVPSDMAPFLANSFNNAMMTLNVFSATIALSPRARFAGMLLRLVDKNGVVKATQAELGALAGMSRAAFRRALAELIDAGVIVTEYGSVKIIDRAALAREARGT